MESNNELKIDLYPENKPKSELKKESIQTIINKDTLAHSFDLDQKFGYLCYKVPVLSGLFSAHCNHYPVKIRPDDIWLLILQSFSCHVNENSEILRRYFVNFDGKKELIIPIECIEVGKKDIELFIEEINKKMVEFLGEEILDNLTPNFTTTDNNSKLVCKISIMNTFKKYFLYSLLQISCGIPYIILEGTAEDYKKIISKAKNLSKYDFEWYIDRIIPIVQKMVQAKEGNIDYNFFKNIILKEDGVVKRSEGCSILSSKYKIVYINGWILKFFAYIKYGDYLHRFTDDKIIGDNINNFPSQIFNVPFIIEKEDKTMLNMKFEAGFFGCEQNDKKEVNPVLGWMVSPNYSKEKGKEDAQFEPVFLEHEDILHKIKINPKFSQIINSQLEIENEKKFEDEKVRIKTNFKI